MTGMFIQSPADKIWLSFNTVFKVDMSTGQCRCTFRFFRQRMGLIISIIDNSANRQQHETQGRFIAARQTSNTFSPVEVVRLTRLHSCSQAPLSLSLSLSLSLTHTHTHTHTHTKYALFGRSDISGSLKVACLQQKQTTSVAARSVAGCYAFCHLGADWPGSANQSKFVSTGGGQLEGF